MLRAASSSSSGGGGTGDVVGPASSVSGNLPSFSDTTGKLIQDSGIASSVVVTTTGSQTLTNKTLTAPIISTISNTGTLTLPISTDTLVGRATTDTLTNKTLTSPVISGGTIDNAVIGGTTAAAATVTTLGSGVHTITSSNASALSVGVNGATNSSFKVDASTASQVTGITVAGSATLNNPIVSATGSDTNIGITFDSKGSGNRVPFRCRPSDTVAVDMYSSTASDRAMLDFTHSKSDTRGTLTNNASGDTLGLISFSSIGSGARVPAASILVTITGTPGSSDSGGGKMELQTTPDGSATRTTGITIDSTQRVQFSGGIIRATRVITAAGTITAATSDDVIIINKTVGAATSVNLFATPTTGQRLTIKDGKGDALTNNITITPAAGTIDGAGTKVLIANYQSADIIYNGTEWNVV